MSFELSNSIAAQLYERLLGGGYSYAHPHLVVDAAMCFRFSFITIYCKMKFDSARVQLKDPKLIPTSNKGDLRCSIPMAFSSYDFHVHKEQQSIQLNYTFNEL